jgi:hypothetical protein
MSFQISGTLERKYETETKGEAFRVRDFVIKASDGGKYDNFVKFQTTQERVDIIDPYDEGDEITVHFDLRGRQWQDRYFTNLNAWRVERAAAGNARPAPATASDPDVVLEATDADETLPF